MKILMVNKFLYPNGGSETYMLNLSEYLKKSGNEVEFFGMDSKERCVSNRINCYTDNVDLRQAGLKDMLAYSIKSVYSSEAAKKIGKVIDAFKPDVVHLNNINFQLTPSIIYEIKKHNIPIVQTVHDVQIACPNHMMYIEHTQSICQKCLSGKYINCVKNKCIHNSTLKSISAAVESYYYHKRNTYNLVDLYICPSKFMANAIENGGVEKKRITVLPNYCEKQDFSKLTENNKKYVLYFGRLSVEKGIKTLVECAKHLPDINFIFAGTGPLEHECDGIANISAVGFKSGNELKSLIANASFTVCPSEWYENCPMSIIESLSLATPVVASDLGGSKELIKENITGLIFEAGNVEKLTQTVSSLYYNDELISKMSSKCVENNTDAIDAYAEKLIKIYQNLILKERKNNG